MELKKIHFKNIQYSLGKGKVLCYVPTAFEKLQGKRERSYTIEGALGQGGFGITYLASSIISVGNVKQKVYFAIKEYFVKGQCWRETGDTRMFLPKAEEARTDVLKWMDEFEDEAKRLNEICKSNPHVVNVNEVFRANDTAYYVMEFLDGGSLKEMIDERNGLSEADALSIILPIAKTVSDLHQNHRIIHCDIKPDNIMMRMNDDDTRYPVLIDFGESRHFNPDGSLTSKRDAVGGSPGYAPLEQSAGEITEQVDVYALGATLLHALSGKKPQSASSVDDKYILDRLPQTTSAHVRDAVIHAMQTSKHNRTPTMADFVQEVTNGIVPPEKPDELPIGYILNGLGAYYRIASQGVKRTDHIKYKAIRFTKKEEALSSPTGTVRAQIDIYEFFVDGCHHRNDDMYVSLDGDTSIAWQQYLKLCREKTNNSIAQEFQTSKGEGWMTFEANNTYYLVWTKNRKPLPWRKIVTYSATGIGSLLLVWGAVSIIQRIDAAKEIERQEMSRQLTEAITSNDWADLRWFAEHDSTRAYLPYAKLCLDNGDFATAKTFAELSNSDSLLTILTQREDSIRQVAIREQIFDSLLNVARQQYNANHFTAAKTTIEKMDSEYLSKVEVLILKNNINAAVGRADNERIVEQQRQEQEKKRIEQEKKKQEQSFAFQKGRDYYNAWSSSQHTDNEALRSAKYWLKKADQNDKRVQNMLNRLNEFSE